MVKIRTSILKHAVRRTRTDKKSRAKRGQSNTIPPLNPEERGMSGPEPPPSEARVSYSNHITFPLKSPSGIERTSRLSGPPQAPTLVTPGKVTAKSLPTIIKGTLLITSERKIHLLSIQSYPESSRQPQHPQISRTLKKHQTKSSFPEPSETPP